MLANCSGVLALTKHTTRQKRVKSAIVCGLLGIPTTRCGATLGAAVPGGGHAWLQTSQSADIANPATYLVWRTPASFCALCPGCRCRKAHCVGCLGQSAALWTAECCTSVRKLQAGRQTGRQVGRIDPHCKRNSSSVECAPMICRI
jgi:hypothetical protein